MPVIAVSSRSVVEDFRRVGGVEKLHVVVETLEHHHEHALFCVLIGTETSWCDGFNSVGSVAVQANLVLGSG